MGDTYEPLEGHRAALKPLSMERQASAHRMSALPGRFCYPVAALPSGSGIPALFRGRRQPVSPGRLRANKAPLTAIEICAGAGGQALGLEQAGFEHVAAVEIDKHACATLRMNRDRWRVFEEDLRNFPGTSFRGVDLLAGGVPCPPFSIAGKRLGANDERDLFPEALRLVEEIRPAAVMLENVRGFASERFTNYRNSIIQRLERMGYVVPPYRVIHASEHGVPQQRPRFILVALRPKAAAHFVWPKAKRRIPTVSEIIGDLMASRGWPGAESWIQGAHALAPTIVGGSKKHGGPDLGPTRARREWAKLGVDGLGIADAAPGPEFPIDKMPKLTVPMVARIQGFPDNWKFSGGKTAAYRQVGNAFPPPVARAVGEAIRHALTKSQAESTAGRAKPQQLHWDEPEFPLAGT
jgi:DNA (cytosine-5)-methyltransferase 1